MYVAMGGMLWVLLLTVYIFCLEVDVIVACGVCIRVCCGNERDTILIIQLIK